MQHDRKTRPRLRLGGAALALLPALGLAAAPASPYVEELTSPELAARIAHGATTVLVPIGGTEQSGPHIVVGKHNVRARLLAERIALRLGDALVAPVLAYVPEGAIDPPAAHMRFPGTISVPVSAFESVLEASARSFCRHGVRAVFFLGDHGGYQDSLARVAQRFAGNGACRVHALPAYYNATQTGYVADLKARGHGGAEIGKHAGLADTALMLALDPSLVRRDQLAAGARAGRGGGVDGDPARATAALGQLGVERIVAASVDAIRAILHTDPSRQRAGQH